MEDNLIKEQKLDKEVYFKKALEAFDKAIEEGRIDWFKENCVDIRDFKLGWQNVVTYDIMIFLKPQYNYRLDKYKLRYNVGSGWEYRKVNNNRNLYGGGA